MVGRKRFRGILDILAQASKTLQARQAPDLPQAALQISTHAESCMATTGGGARCQVQWFAKSRKILLPSYFRHSAAHFWHPTSHFRNLQAGKHAMLLQTAVSGRTCQSHSPCFASFGQSRAARNRHSRFFHRPWARICITILSAAPRKWNEIGGRNMNAFEIQTTAMHMKESNLEPIQEGFHTTTTHYYTVLPS